MKNYNLHPPIHSCHIVHSCIRSSQPFSSSSLLWIQHRIGEKPDCLFVLSVCSLHSRETHRMMYVVSFHLVSHFERNVQKRSCSCVNCVIYVVFIWSRILRNVLQQHFCFWWIFITWQQIYLYINPVELIQRISVKIMPQSHQILREKKFWNHHI